MSLETGRKLAHYEILEPIGKGGMGEVYRARDGKLGRDVAIKVLPDEFSRNAERLARFKREAKILASLNHPNIAAIYGLEQSDSIHYLVLELVPGETLAERIARGPIPVDEAVEIATKVAEGLEEAHERGIIHRDLKPANIKLTPDGKVKILDFGLAKAFVDESPVADDSMSPTITRDATRAGVILGTAAYMSPEQAKGKAIDRRTDIFAFGSVLYEMLAGRKVFRGEGVSDVLAAVIKDEPDWSSLPGDTSASLRKLMRRCLAKAPAKRVQHIGDVRLEIEEAFLDEPMDVRPSRSPWLSRAAMFFAGVAVTIAGWLVIRPEAPNNQPVSWWRIALPPGASLSETDNTNGSPALAISPNGRHLAYIARREGNNQLYLRTVGVLDATPVDGAENASMPFFSADGQALGFLSANGTLMRVSLNGGAPVAISEVGIRIRGASWSLDGNVMFSSGSSGALHRVAAAGGESEVVALPDRDSRVKALRLPDVLPGGEAVLLTVMDLDAVSFDDAVIAAFWPTTGEMRVLVQGGTNARYSPSGHLVYARAGALYAAPFDASAVEVTGDPVRVLEGVATYPTMGPAEFGLSRDGSLLYAPGEPLGIHSRIVWVDRTGRATTLVEELRPFMDPTVSSDGRVLAVGTNDANVSLWRYDIAQGTLTRIVSGGNNSNPVWAPDGKHIAFTSDREGSFDIFSIAADGSGRPRMLLDVDSEVSGPLSRTPDGQSLVFYQHNARTGYDLWSLGDDGETVPILTTTANETSAEIAPDGRWMAYQSDESGRPEIYVCTFPNAESRRRVSVDGGAEPRWNPNGRELFYRNGNKMMVVEVDSGGNLAVARPQLLFESDAYSSFGERWYDVSADGERFVMIDVSESPQPPTEMVLVQNWAEELKRLVPTN